MAPRTLHVIGSGGAKFDVDVPEEGHAVERFVQRILTGDIRAVGDDGADVDRNALVDELDPDYEYHSAPPGARADDEADPLADMSIAKLRKFAVEEHIDLGDAKKRDDILEVIRAELDDRSGTDDNNNDD